MMGLGPPIIDLHHESWGKLPMGALWIRQGLWEQGFREQGVWEQRVWEQGVWKHGFWDHGFGHPGRLQKCVLQVNSCAKCVPEGSKNVACT